MCVIVDANLASLTFKSPPDSDCAPIITWLLKKDGLLIYGGQLARELRQVEIARRFLLTLQRAGRAKLIPDPALEEEEELVHASGLCQSNDAHVIALARVSGARTLCSRDTTLHKDFKNSQLIAKPRGAVYQTAKHQKLLRHTTSCRKNRKK
jgi:hypothetical protein